MDAIYSILRPWLSQSVMKLKSLIGCLCYKPVFFILKNVMLNIINEVECELNLRTWIFFEKRLIYLFLMSYASGDWNFFIILIQRLHGIFYVVEFSLLS